MCQRRNQRKLESSVGSRQRSYMKVMPSPQAVLATWNILFPVPVILQSPSLLPQSFMGGSGEHSKQWFAFFSRYRIKRCSWCLGVDAARHKNSLFGRSPCMHQKLGAASLFPGRSWALLSGSRADHKACRTSLACRAAVRSSSWWNSLSFSHTLCLTCCVILGFTEQD